MLGTAHIGTSRAQHPPYRRPRTRGGVEAALTASKWHRFFTRDSHLPAARSATRAPSALLPGATPRASAPGRPPTRLPTTRPAARARRASGGGRCRGCPDRPRPPVGPAATTIERSRSSPIGGGEVRLPRVDRHPLAGRGVVPQVTCVEHHRVQPRRLLAQTVRVRVGQHVCAVDLLDRRGWPLGS